MPSFLKRLSTYRHPLTWSYLFSYLVNAPLYAMYGLLQFILCKDLKASALQITILITVKPMVAVFSSYWSALIANRPDRLKSNLLWASFLGVVPTFAFPWITNNWVLIVAFALYFFTERAIIPAWMEIIRIRLPKEEQSRTVSSGTFIAFIASSFFPILVAPWMDLNPGVWKWLFPLFGIMSLLRLGAQWLIHLPTQKFEMKENPSLKTFVSAPWKNSWDVIKRRPDFGYYQLIFFFGGLGVMVMQPALPKFIDSVLHLSYTQLALAFALCKGAGFALTNPFWSARLQRTNIFLYCGVVTFCAAISLLLIALSSYITFAIYLAFFCYGVMQAGSQLSWQLGGAIFADNEDSSRYTSINIMLVGVRGFIGPFCGGLLCLLGLNLPFYVGAMLCLTGSLFGVMGSKRVVIKQV